MLVDIHARCTDNHLDGAMVRRELERISAELRRRTGMVYLRRKLIFGSDAMTSLGVGRRNRR